MLQIRLVLNNLETQKRMEGKVMLLKLAMWYVTRTAAGVPTMGKIDGITGKVVW